VKRLDLGELRDQGYLLEVNRQFFHPLGLSLAVRYVAGKPVEMYVADFREEPAGVVFPALCDEDAGRADFVECERIARAGARFDLYGYTVQPLPGTEGRRFLSPETLRRLSAMEEELERRGMRARSRGD
jgi:hypothetical protein